MQRQFFFTKSIKISRFLLQKGRPFGQMNQKEGQQYREIPKKDPVVHCQRFSMVQCLSMTNKVLFLAKILQIAVYFVSPRRIQIIEYHSVT